MAQFRAHFLLYLSLVCTKMISQ